MLSVGLAAMLRLHDDHRQPAETCRTQASSFASMSNCTMNQTQERAVFEMFMERRMAQLQDAAKRYTGRLIPEHRDAFLTFALNQAWERRAELKPGTEDAGVLQWWEECCLRPAALSRATWTLRTWDRQLETVRGRHLHRSAF
jgi:hypothetical protein